jgi:magnesium transporter
LKTSPGTLKYVGKVVHHNIKIKIVEFDIENCIEKTISNDFGKISVNHTENKKTWLNVDGIHQPNVIEEIGKIFNLHPLLLEDILNTNQKPKIEYYGNDILYFTLKAINFNPYTKVVESEHVSMVMGPDFLITFQEEGTGDIFKELYQRLKNPLAKARKFGIDYMLFSAIDLIIDNYLGVIEQIDDDIAILEDDIIHFPKERDQNLLYDYKKEVNIIRKHVFPIREMLNSILVFNENDMVKDNTKLYFRDAQDHAVQVVEMLDSNREMIASLMDLYLSQVSNKMNNVMKVLTIISVIFMPLTFIVGVYGMNFENMPELKWKYGYFMVLGLIAIITIFMLIYFRKKKWL